ncbi:hypothetical protein ACIA5D_50220 [Actinoplanes sp. NPDC051513]|uniref:hypothetical protein n=1 Tax=Actinoplanes sp. NPDC051513 TaxID=3363908 RepID=UPI0037942E72
MLHVIYIVGPAVVALLVAGFVVLRRRRRGGSRMPATFALAPAGSGQLPETFAVAPAEGARLPDSEESDAERRERLLWTAFRAGDIPACWYRQQMAAIAADTADQGPGV